MEIKRPINPDYMEALKIFSSVSVIYEITRRLNKILEEERNSME